MNYLIALFFFVLGISPLVAQNVGMGTVTPSAQLDIRGVVKVDSFQNVHTPGTFLEWNKDSVSGMSYLLNHRGSFAGGFILGSVNNDNQVTERLRLDASGNLGIGVVPGGTLDVMRGSATNGNGAFRGTTYTSWFNYGPNEDTYIRGGKSTSAVILNDLGGNVGIGSNPENKLSVYGHMYISGNIGIATSTPTSARLVIGGNPAEEGLNLSMSDQFANLRVIRNSLSTIDHHMYFGYQSGENSSLHFYSDNVETMAVSDTSVGIGTNTPMNIMDVAGGVAIGSTYSGSATAPANGLIVEGRMGVGTSTPANKMDVEGGLAVGTTYAGSSTAPANGLVVEGKVGIGENNPTTAKLVISGSSTSEGLDLASDNLYANMSVIRNSLSTLDKNLYLGSQSGLNSSVRLYSNDTLSMAVTNTKVGIGTTAPKSKLDVEGSVSIGNTYAGTYAAPADGAIIEGNVGIGTNTPSDRLHVAGSIRIADGTQANNRIYKSDPAGKGNWNNITSIDFHSESALDMGCAASTDYFNIPLGILNEVVVSNGYAYVLNMYDINVNYFHVFDVSDPYNLVQLGVYELQEVGYYTDPATGMTIVGNTLLIMVDDYLLSYDISVPSAPQFLDYIYLVTNGQLDWQFATYGNYIYLGGGYSPIMVIDFSDPSNLVPNYISQGLNRRFFKIYDHYLYTIETSGYQTQIWDISNPFSPVSVAVYQQPNTNYVAYPNTIQVKDSIMYILGVERMQVLSLASPTQPSPLALLFYTGISRSSFIQDHYLYSCKTWQIDMINIESPSNPYIEGAFGTNDLKEITHFGDFVIGYSNSSSGHFIATYSTPCFQNAFDFDHASGASAFENPVWVEETNDLWTASQTGSIGIGYTNPSTTLDVNGAMRSSFSGSYVFPNLPLGGVTNVNMPVPPMPSDWNPTNTLVLVSNSDGAPGTITQAGVVNSTTIQMDLVQYEPGAVRFNYIVFKL